MFYTSARSSTKSSIWLLSISSSFLSSSSSSSSKSVFSVSYYFIGEGSLFCTVWTLVLIFKSSYSSSKSSSIGYPSGMSKKDWGGGGSYPGSWRLSIPIKIILSGKIATPSSSFFLKMKFSPIDLYNLSSLRIFNFYESKSSFCLRTIWDF